MTNRPEVPSLAVLAAGGYFYCSNCDRVCELVDNGHGGNVCAWCASPRFVYHSPVLASRDPIHVEQSCGPPPLRSKKPLSLSDRPERDNV